MNEIQIIQKQLATERAHFAEIALLCGAGGTSGASSAGYPRGTSGASSAGYPRGTSGANGVSDSSAARGTSDTNPAADLRNASFAAACTEYFAFALTRFEPPVAARLATLLNRGLNAEFSSEFARCSQAHFEKLDALLARNLTVTEWRTVSRIDADSILAERARFARVKSALPA